MRLQLTLSLVVALASVACGNTYHPEYHPVNVMRFQQHLAYPVTVQNGSQPAPVVIAPVMPPYAVQPPPPWPNE